MSDGDGRRLWRTRVACIALAMVAAACGSGDGESAEKDRDDSGVSGSGTASPPVSEPDGCAVASIEGMGQTTTRSIATGGEERAYLVFVPSSYVSTEPLPVVLNLHGAGGNAQEHADSSQLTSVAESEGFILIHPEASASTDRNWQMEGLSEAEYVEDLLSTVAGEMCVDASRLFVVGASQGGDLATLLACQLPDRIAAVATITVLNHHDQCGPPSATPVLAFLGTADPLYDIEKGLLLPPGVGGVATEDLIPGPLADEADAWATTNGCGSAATKETVAPGTTRHEYDCPRGGDLVYYVHPGGHVWPGVAVPAEFAAELGPAVPDLDANALIWEFFKAHGA